MTPISNQHPKFNISVYLNIYNLHMMDMRSMVECADQGSNNNGHYWWHCCKFYVYVTTGHPHE